MISLAILFLLVGVVIFLSTLMLYGAWQSDRLIRRFEKEHVVFPLMEYASRTTYLWLGWRLVLFNLHRLLSQKDDKQEIALMGTGEERELVAFLSQEKKPAKARAWGKLVRALIVAGLCSSAHVYGILTIVRGVPLPESDASLPILAILLMIGSPISLGLYLRPDWRGALGGILGLVGEVIGFFAGGIVLIEFSISQGYNNFILEQAMLMTIISGFGIGFLLLTGGIIKTRREIAGLTLGLFVGATGAVLISPSLPSQTEYLTFAWVWIMAILFPALLNGKTIFPEPHA